MFYQSGISKQISDNNIISKTNGFERITDTNAHTGDWVEIEVVVDATFTTLTAASDAPITGTFTGVAFAAGTKFKGRFTAITLTSGEVYAYNA